MNEYTAKGGTRFKHNREMNWVRIMRHEDEEGYVVPYPDLLEFTRVIESQIAQIADGTETEQQHGDFEHMLNRVRSYRAQTDAS